MKQVICYVVLDPEFFILVSPNYDAPEERIRIEKKRQIKTVDAQVDTRRDQRNLVVRFNEFDPTDPENPKTEQLTLYFENMSACNLVLNAVNDNKKQQKKYTNDVISHFLQSCIDHIKDDL